MAVNKLSSESLTEKSLYEIGNELAKSLDPGIKKMDDLIERFVKLQSIYKNTTSRSEVIKLIQKENGLTEQTNVAKKEQERLELNLIKTIERKKLATESTNRALIEHRLETQRLNARMKEEAVLRSKTSKEIDKALVKRKQLERTIRDYQLRLKLGQKLSDKEQKELKDSTREYLKYDGAIKHANKTVGKHQENVGNYPKIMQPAIGAFKAFIPMIGLGFGLREAWNFSQEALELARQAKGIEFAFRNLGAEGVLAFDKVKASTKGLISDLKIKQAIVEFDNFNLKTEQLDTVLEFVAVRATQTGKSFEYLRDSAIEAISKESVRRADNLGLSQKELNDKIKEGGTFLEAFNEIAQREIKEAGNVLEEAGNSQQRFNAAFENFKVSAGSGFIKSLTDDLYDMGTALTDTLADVNDASNGFWSYLGNLSKVASGQGILVKGEAILQRELNKRKPLVKEIISLQEKQGIEERQIQINRHEYMKKNSVELTEMLENLKKQSGETKEVVKNVAYYRTEIEKLRNKQGDLTESDIKQSNEIKNKIKAYQKIIDKLTNIKNTSKDSADYEYKLTLFRIEQQIKAQEEILNSEKSSAREKLRAIQEREEYELQLVYTKEDKLLSKANITKNERILIEEQTAAKIKEIYSKSLKDIDDLGISLDSIIEIPETEDWSDDLNILEEGIKNYAKALGEDPDKAWDEFVKKHGYAFDKVKGFYKDLDKAAEKSAKEREQLELELKDAIIDYSFQIAEGVQDLMNTLWEGKLQKYDQELEKNDELYSAKYEAAEGDAVLQEALREEQERKRKEIEKKKRKEERKLAIANKLYNLGLLAAQTALAVTSAFAPPPVGLGPLAGNLLVPLIYANAGIQAAVIASQPLPAYAKGTDDHKGGWALVGEERPEVILEPGRDPYVVDNPSVLNLPKHTQVIPSIEEYQKIFNATQLASLDINNKRVNSYKDSQQVFTDKYMKELIVQNKELIEVTKRKKVNIRVNQQKTDINHELFRHNNTNWA